MNMAELAVRMAKAVKELVESGVDGLRKEFSERITQLESRPAPKDGKDGSPGEKGRDGRDGIEIDILPTINPRRSYERGLYASHDGGIWKSVRDTSGMDGWECVLAGIADLSVKFDGERTVSVMVRRSGMAEADPVSFKMPVVIDRGTFKHDASYEVGDGVTFGGNFWIAQTDRPDAAPGTTKDWRLSVRKGRDGRDMRDSASTVDKSKGVSV